MFERILLPLDGSKQSARAVAVAMEMAKRFKSSIVVAQVVEPVGNPGWQTASLTDAQMIDTVLEELERQERASITRSRRYVAAVKKQVEGQGVKATTHVLLGQPANVLLNLVPKEKVSLVVMTTRGQGGLRRAVMGSVADKLVRESPAPVLLVGPTAPVNGAAKNRAKPARKR